MGAGQQQLDEAVRDLFVEVAALRAAAENATHRFVKAAFIGSHVDAEAVLHHLR